MPARGAEYYPDPPVDEGGAHPDYFKSAADFEPPEFVSSPEPARQSWLDRALKWVRPRPAPKIEPPLAPPKLSLVPPAPRTPPPPAPQRPRLVLVTDATAAELSELRRADGEAKVVVGLAKLREGLRLLSDDPAPPDLSESYRELCRAQKEIRRIVRRTPRRGF